MAATNRSQPMPSGTADDFDPGPIDVVTRGPVSPEQVRTLAQGTISAYLALKTFVEAHEATVRKRWLKKNVRQRRTILTKAWEPFTLSEHHRPDIWALRHPNIIKQGRDKVVNYFKFPFLNFEDLTQPRPLMLLLNSRAHNPPTDFAFFEFSTLKTGFTTGNYHGEIPNVGKHTLYLLNVASIDKYGELLAWSDHPDALTDLERGAQFDPGLGYMVLECQKRILEFLLKCGQQIVPDSAQTPLPKTPAPVRQELDSLPVGPDSSYIDSRTLVADLPYVRPPKYAIGEILGMARAAFSDMEDHIWDLQEDPCYFSSHAQPSSTERWGCYTCAVQGRASKIPVPAGRVNVYWNLNMAFMQICLWNRLINDIEAADAALPPNIDDPQCVLSEDAALKLVKLREMVIVVLLHTISSMEPYFSHNKGVGWTCAGHRHKRDPSWSAWRTTPMDKAPDVLPYLIGIMCDRLSLFRVHTLPLLAEIQDLVEQDRSRNELPAIFMGHMHLLVILAILLDQVKSFYHKSPKFMEVGVGNVRDMGTEAELKKFYKDLEHVSRATRNVVIPPSLQRSVHYPVDKAPTRANIEAMCKAEATLDSFWTDFDLKLAPAGASLKELLREHAGIQARAIRRTPAPDSPEAKPVVRGLPDLKILTPALSGMQLNSPEPLDSPRRFVPDPEKQKVKTVGQPAPPPREPVEAPAPEAEEPAAPDDKVQVDPRAMRVFEFLFFTPNAERQRARTGEIPWTDFCQAMASAGFDVHKMGGSATMFVPPEIEGRPPRRRITFHEPHPARKIRFTIGRVMGRRLTLAYGWTIDTFVLR